MGGGGEGSKSKIRRRYGDSKQKSVEGTNHRWNMVKLKLSQDVSREHPQNKPAGRRIIYFIFQDGPVLCIFVCRGQHSIGHSSDARSCIGLTGELADLPQHFCRFVLVYLHLSSHKSGSGQHVDQHGSCAMADSKKQRAAWPRVGCDMSHVLLRNL